MQPVCTYATRHVKSVQGGAFFVAFKRTSLTANINLLPRSQPAHPLCQSLEAGPGGCQILG